MGVIDGILKNKRRGDAIRIATAVNRERKEQGLEPYSFGAIRSMLNGNRTLTDEVNRVAKRYYSAMNEFNNAMIV